MARSRARLSENARSTARRLTRAGLAPSDRRRTSPIGSETGIEREAADDEFGWRRAGERADIAREVRLIVIAARLREIGEVGRLGRLQRADDRGEPERAREGLRRQPDLVAAPRGELPAAPT